ncbi:aminopeptidase N [bacterium SCSIO 12696]|nr:aminopeptidase N [bacterium SCSIO 12696]
MKDAQPKTIYLKDYQPPSYAIDRTELRVELLEEGATVAAKLTMRRNSHVGESTELVLHGIELELRELKVDGRALEVDEYDADRESLTIKQVPAEFVLESLVFIKPQENTSLEGLYKSGGMFCTQCEAEGFRKITYYLDRPDVMSEYTTTVVADKTRCPVLLSNGNPIDSGELDSGRHFVTWHDPFKKPSYLFALVAGDLEFIEDSFTTISGREIELRIFVEEKDIDKCDHAMRSLKKSMAWDEEVYGREYDLDIFMIVAVDAFNMGAMENKGLNIFNTSAVLAKTETTTDAAFQRVEAIVAHEYFHNWSGNRVTCRDWFQLSLKEGFTVFRDAEFSADMGSRVVKRVEDASLLRTAQFSEDAGPMAHPVQPASFIEISNFYTLTVYEKGCEVVRMYHTLLGPEKFREATDLYFERHDGEAATIDDFAQCMAQVSGRDLTQFKRWYSQAGTPRVDVTGHYDAEAQTYRLEFTQSCPATPEATEKAPFLIPVRVGLVGEQGDLPLKLQGVEQTENTTELVLEITEREQSVVFERVAEPPTPSLLRDFSAPIKLDFPHSRDDLTFLMSRDSDGFNRWDACQKLATDILEELVQAQLDGQPMVLDGRLVEACRTVLTDTTLDPAMVALMLKLPSEAYLAEEADVIYVDEIHAAREFVRQQLANQLSDEFRAAYHNNQVEDAYQPSAEQIAKRSLKNTALGYLMLADDTAVELARRQYDLATNMTDRSAALSLLVGSDNAAAKQQAGELIPAFYNQWQHEALVVNQWFAIQAMAPQAGGVERVQALMQHPAFDLKNPNKVRSLIGAFCANNHSQFHRTDGSGYQLLADAIIELDSLNPQIAARLMSPLSKWQKQIPQRQQLMREQLARIMAVEGLSKDVYEVVSKSLK